jgi:hypothetical protein
MKNTEVRGSNKDDFPIEYFQRWKKRGQKSEKIYFRLTPQDKEIILSACEETGLSISDLVVGAAMEASEAIIKDYHRRFPNSLMFKSVC